MKKLLPIFFIAFVAQLNAQITDEKLDQIIGQLSITEKVYMVVGTGMNIPGISETSNAPQSIVGKTQDKIPGAAGTSYTNKKLGYPAVVFADGPAGIRIDPLRESNPNETFYATAFPTATSIASTWNVALAQEVGAAFGREGKDYGVDFLLAPALNIHRNPLGGRNFEYYSEDPLLSGKIAAAFVNGVQSEGIGATLKHFVANNSETNRTALNTVVSERALREIYLKGFEIAIKESKPWSVMSSYNKINGIYASENEELLTKLLREEWNFEGFAMSDWFGGQDATAQMMAGNDLLMPGANRQSESIIEAVRSGLLPEKILDRNIKNILKQYFKTHSFNNYKPTGKPDLENNKTVSRNAAIEGMVLLENNNVLPLNNTAKVALFGVSSVETIAGGSGSGDVNTAYTVSVTEGLITAGYALDSELVTTYEAYVTAERAKIPPKKMFLDQDILVNEMQWEKESLEPIAEKNDVAIFTLGRTAGEVQDREIEGDFKLTRDELALIKNISEVFHAKNKKFIILLNIGGVIETQSWKHYADAVLLAWQPGQEGGHAIADIISGKANPSGKLPVTFPIALTDVASTKNFPGKVLDPTATKPDSPLRGLPSEEIYEEGIYVGYRYFDTFNVPSSYAFGYGLSYTQFKYSNLVMTSKGDELTIECTIKNTGTMPGKEVVQLYVQSPVTKVEKATKELKAFAKTDVLKTGELQKVTFKIHTNDLGYYDTPSHSWKLDQGNYELLIASDSKTTKLSTKTRLKAKVIKTTQKLLSPIVKIKELTKQ